MIALLALSSAGCDGSRGGGAPTAASVAAPPSATASADSAVVVHVASRCGECHGALYEEWRPSRHAMSGSSATYKAMLAAAGADAAACRGCHTPLERFVGAADPAAIEGVDCEACHAIRNVEISEKPGGASIARTTFAILDQAKQGPRCDAKPHYFHKMGCAPLFRKAELCAGCHLWSRHVGAAELPVFTEYDDYRVEHFAKEGLVCQDCHMPGVPREVAVGARKLPDVSFHGDIGPAGALRKKTLELEVAVRDSGARVAVEVTLTNVGAGHAVPTGMPGQEVVLRVVTSDASGVQGRAERTFGRVLVDDAGREVPFTSAVREGKDSRLYPAKPRTETFELAAPNAGKVEVAVLYRALSPALSAALGVPAADETLMTSAEISFGAPGAARAKLPRSVKVKP